jgi:hypothetical protein
LPIIERIRRIDQPFLKIKYIWLNYQKKTRTKLISKHVFPALKNYHFWPFWKIHEWIVKKLDVLEKIWDPTRDQRVGLIQKRISCRAVLLQKSNFERIFSRFIFFFWFFHVFWSKMANFRRKVRTLSKL